MYVGRGLWMTKSTATRRSRVRPWTTSWLDETGEPSRTRAARFRWTLRSRPRKPRDCGVSRRVFERLVRSGLVRCELRGVYAAAQAPNDPLMRATRPRPGARLRTRWSVDRTAAWLHGLDALRRSAFYEAPPLRRHPRHGHTDESPWRRRPPARPPRRGDITDGPRDPGHAQLSGPPCDCGRLLWRYDGLAVIDGFLRLGVPQDADARRAGPRSRATAASPAVAYLVSIGDGASRVRSGVAPSGCTGTTRDSAAPSCSGGCTPTPAYRSSASTSLIPQLRYGAEYDGEEFHTERRWTTARRGTTRVARKGTRLEDRRVPQGSPCSRTRSACRELAAGGSREARRHLSLWTPHAAYAKPRSASTSVHRTPARQRWACSRIPRSAGISEERRLRRRRGTRWSSSPVTPRAGVSWTVPSARAPGRRRRPCRRRRPRTTPRRVRFRAGKVRVIRSGGGLGEPVTATAIRSSTSSCGKPGNSEATWPSGPMPSITTSNAPDPCSRTSSAVRRGGRPRASVPASDAGIACTGPGRPDVVEEVAAGLPVVAVGGVGGHVALVAPPEVHPRPVDVGAGSELGHGLVDRVRDGAAGQRTLPAPGRSPAPARAARRTARATAWARAAASCEHLERRLDRRRPALREPLRRRRRRRRRGRAGAAPRPAARIVAPLEGDRPVGLAGGDERGQPPSAREIVMSPLFVRQHHLGDARARRSTRVHGDPQPVAQPGRQQVGARADPLGRDRRRRHLVRVLVERRGEQRPPRVIRVQARSVLPGGVRRALGVHRPGLGRRAAAASVIRRCRGRRAGRSRGPRARRPATTDDGGVGQQQREHDGLGVLGDLAVEPDQRVLAGPAGADADLRVDRRPCRGRRRGSRRGCGPGARARRAGAAPSPRRRRPRRRR